MGAAIIDDERFAAGLGPALPVASLRTEAPSSAHGARAYGQESAGDQAARDT